MFKTGMATYSVCKATQMIVFSCRSWARGCCRALQPQQYQSQTVFPFIWKTSRPFSVLQHMLPTSKAVALCSLALKSEILKDKGVKSILKTVRMGQGLHTVRLECGGTDEQRRGFSLTAPAANQHGMGKGDVAQELGHKTPTPSGEEDWALRLANENGYLSWCRNCYLTTVVAIAMMAEGTTPWALQAAEGALFVAGLNLTWGTYQYVYNLLRLRHRTGMSAFGALIYVSMATLHLFLWLIVCTIFLGYTEEPENKVVVPEKLDPKQQGQDV